MYITDFKINGIDVAITDQPEGLNEAAIVYERDAFSGMEVMLDLDLTFRCGSGKEAIDEEYDTRFVDGIGTMTIVDDCGGSLLEYPFKLNFAKYRRDSEKTTIGLIEDNVLNAFKDNLKNDIEIPDASAEFAYIRNIPIDYNYYSSKWSSAEKLQTGFIIDQTLAPGAAETIISINPRTYTEINELEDGYALTAESVNIQSILLCSFKNMDYIDPSGALVGMGVSFYMSTNIEPQAVFENKIEDGVVVITTTGDTDLTMNMPSTGIAILQHYCWRECIAIGKTFDNIRKGVYNVFNDTPQNISSISGVYFWNNATYPTKSLTITENIKQGENVWIWYEIMQTGDPASAGIYSFKFDEYNMDINRDLTIKYTALQKASSGTLNTNAELEDYSTVVKAFNGTTICNELYPNISSTLFGTSCYSELHFTNGEYMRNKANIKPFKMTPQFFFDELDKVISCGLGVYYDVSNNATLELNPIEDFYSDTIGLAITDEFDDVTIEVDESRLYNRIEIGYSNFKDSPEEIHGKNEYNIIEQVKGKNTWSKVTDFIASKFLIKRALKLGSEDKDLEFDKNIFLLNLRYIPPYYFHSASQSTTPSALGYDSVGENNAAQNFGMNRKYATIFNLIRSKLRWSFGMFNNKTDMESTSLSDKELQSFLTPCIPNGFYNANKSIVYADVDGSYRQIPIFISFSKLMTLEEFLTLRQVWYKAVTIEVDGVTYKGNILRADHKNGITKFKLTGQS